MNRATLSMRSAAAAALILMATAPALAQDATTAPTTDPAATTATPDTTVDRTAADTVPDRAEDRRPEEDRDFPWGLLGLLGLAGLMKKKDETRVVHNHNTGSTSDTRR